MSDFLGAVKRILFAVLTAFKKELEDGDLVVGAAKQSQRIGGATLEDIKYLISLSSDSSNQSLDELRSYLDSSKEFALLVEDEMSFDGKTNKQHVETLISHIAIQDKKIKILSEAILALK